LLRGAHPAYISWEEHHQLLAAIAEEEGHADGGAGARDPGHDGQGLRVATIKSVGGATYSTYFVYNSAGSLLWEMQPSGYALEYVYVDGKQAVVRVVRP